MVCRFIGFIINQIVINKVNTNKRPFTVRIKNVDEVRMGSPYHCCDIELAGYDIYVEMLTRSLNLQNDKAAPLVCCLANFSPVSSIPS